MKRVLYRVWCILKTSIQSGTLNRYSACVFSITICFWQYFFITIMQALLSPLMWKTEGVQLVVSVTLFHVTKRLQCANCDDHHTFICTCKSSVDDFLNFTFENFFCSNMDEALHVFVPSLFLFN